MTNFTEEIKNEIIQSGADGRCCYLAVLSAFIRTSGNVFYDGGNYGFEITTENESTAEFISDILENGFRLNLTVSGAKFDIMSGRDKLSFICRGEGALSFLKEACLIKEENGRIENIGGISDELISKDCCKVSYIKGVFLGGGSCTLPEERAYSSTGYHLEFVFSNKFAANDFSALLCDFEILSKLVSRKENFVVYVKSKEIISDILNILSAHSSLAKLNRIAEKKDRKNNDNRVNNCSVSNIDKTVTASANQVRYIEIISGTVGLQSLDRMLFEVAEARLADKNASMQELAARLGISKSCLNHRMRKISDIAKSLE